MDGLLVRGMDGRNSGKAHAFSKLQVTSGHDF